MNVEHALAAAGYTYVRDYMQPEFDYPLDVFMREDGVWVLGDLTRLPHSYRVLMNPWDTWHERMPAIECDVAFLAWFVRMFNRLAAQQIEMDKR